MLKAMKRLFLLTVAVLVGMAYSVRAQEAKFDEAAILKRIDKLKADTENPKKSGKASTWIELGKAYYDAATIATNGLFRGMDPLTAEMLFPKPEKGTETIADTEYEKWSYPYFDLYLTNGSVYAWKTKKEIVEGALDKAAEAYKKAYEIDPKGAAAKVTEGLTKVSDGYKQDADNYYAARSMDPTAKAFAAAYDVQRHPAVNKIDTMCCFYAGYIYTLEKKFDEGEKYLKDAIANQYESDGDAYYYLFHCYYGRKKFDEAKAVLLEGVTKYPKNTEVLEGLINLYGETGEDPQSIIPYVQKGIENDPTNPELWAGLGRVYDKLGDNTKALETFAKAVELAPDDFAANFNYALMVVRVADDKTAAFNEKTFTSREERDAALEEVTNAYVVAVAPLEKAHGINPQDASTLELLKSVCFRLRDVSPEMMDKFKKYDELYKSMQ